MTSEWISATDAGRILAVPSRSIPDLAGRGLIGCRTLPGRAPRYSRADVERLAAEATRPATTSLAASK